MSNRKVMEIHSKIGLIQMIKYNDNESILFVNHRVVSVEM